MSFKPEELTGGAMANWSYQMVARLKPGISRGTGAAGRRAGRQSH